MTSHVAASMGGKRVIRTAPSTSIIAAMPIDNVIALIPQTLFGNHERLLVVGDGDFTFSLSLARALRPPVVAADAPATPLPSVASSSSIKDSNDVWLVSTSIDSEATLLSRYGRARDVLSALHHAGVRVYHGVDGTQLEAHSDIAALHNAGIRYDAVIFNFPHHGGKGKIQRNRDLVHRFFVSSRNVLKDGGRIVLSLAPGQGGTPVDAPRLFGDHWQVVQLGARAGLILTSMIPFNGAMWPYYQRRGHRSNDKGFHDSGAWTHIFMPSLHPLATLPLSRDAFHAAFTNTLTQWPSSSTAAATASLSSSSSPSSTWRIQRALAPYMGRALLEHVNHPLYMLRRRLEASFRAAVTSSSTATNVNLWASAPHDASSSYIIPSSYVSSRQPFTYDITTNEDSKSSSSSSISSGSLRVDMRPTLWSHPSSIAITTNSKDIAAMVCGDVFERHVLTPGVMDTSTVIPADQWPRSGSRVPLPVVHEAEAYWLLPSSTIPSHESLAATIHTIMAPVIACDITLTLAPSSTTASTTAGHASSFVGAITYGAAIWIGSAPVQCNASLASSQQYASSHTFIYAGYLYSSSSSPSRTVIGYWYRISLDASTLIAFGIGEDHRILWSDDARFCGQYDHTNDAVWPPWRHRSWQPHSVFPAAHGHHVSFWLPLLDHGNGNHIYPLPLSIAHQSMHDTSIKTPDPAKEKALVDEDALGTGRTAATLPPSSLPSSTTAGTISSDDASSSSPAVADNGIARAAWTAERRARKLERRAIMARQTVSGNGVAARAARLGGMSTSSSTLPDGIANSVARATAAKQRRAAKAAADAAAMAIVTANTTSTPVITSGASSVAADEENNLANVFHFDDDTISDTNNNSTAGPTAADTTSSSSSIEATNARADRQTGARRAARKAKSSAAKITKSQRSAVTPSTTVTEVKAFAPPRVDDNNDNDIDDDKNEGDDNKNDTSTEVKMVSLLDRDRTAMATAASTVRVIHDANHQSLVVAFERPLVDHIRAVAGSLIEAVELIDAFVRPSGALSSPADNSNGHVTGHLSLCYRITYRSLCTSLPPTYAARLQQMIRWIVEAELRVRVR